MNGDVRSAGEPRGVDSSAGVRGLLELPELLDHFVDERSNDRGKVSADPVDSPGDEPPSEIGIVHGPGDDSASVGMHAFDEWQIDQLVVLPEITSVGIAKRPKRIDGVARLKNADRNFRRHLSNTTRDPVVEAVHGTPLRTRPNDRNDSFFDLPCFDLHVYVTAVRHYGEELREGGHRTVVDRYLTQLGERCVGDGDPRPGFAGARVRGRVVVYHDHAIDSPVDVQLYGFGSDLEGALERRESVFAILARRSPVADDLGSGGHPCVYVNHWSART
jgi:hypothetical protein